VPPQLSVIVPSVNGWGDLEGCLAALDVQDEALEVLVVDRVGPEVREPVRSRFPGVRLLEADPGRRSPSCARWRSLRHGPTSSA